MMKKISFLLILFVSAVLISSCGKSANSNTVQDDSESQECDARGNSVGDMFVDFEVEYNGEVQKLSDYVGNGKFVLVDFWASWCAPCRGEIPGLIRIYNTYKDKNVDVVGVATWDRPQDTEKAIHELGIPYPQIMNAQKIGSDAYAFDGIPQIILFGPDGKILARDLFGANIEKALVEAMAK